MNSNPQTFSRIAGAVEAPPLPPPLGRRAATSQRVTPPPLEAPGYPRRRGILGRALSWIIYRQPSWLTSLLVHLLLLLILGLFLLPPQIRPSALTLQFAEPEAFDMPLDTLQLETEEPAGAAPAEPPLQLTDAFEPTPIAMPEIALPTVPTVAQADVIPSDAAAELQALMSAGNPGGFAGRQGRRGVADRLGATAASEEAVDRALIWLAAHQLSDGSWNFDLRERCDGSCSHRGSGSAAAAGATALALLPFLGAGQTHEQGYHRSVVQRGLQRLLNKQNRDGSFLEPQGTMYSHGLATLVLCEALAMTKSDPGGVIRPYKQQPKLRAAAQRAVDYIVESQHRNGGWRYAPKQAGDTSVVGWQAMALQSAKLAGLRVRKQTLDDIHVFLDSVQGDDYGGTYGYTSRGTRPVTTAVGLLCRMYGGWTRNSAGVMSGADYLHELGPSSNNVYFNYYATQVLHHFQGKYWEEWHPMLRDYLVESQEREGHAAGSWYFPEDYGSQVGGRLYITAMSAMVLEVYYRHMPIYTNEAVVQSEEWGPLRP
ncbi:MAG: terpene cyclase/mutase family protein [Planctomycetales bacterium]|nr:terpene cyclase/mutase family protein [Planctomycetales bacterium]